MEAVKWQKCQANSELLIRHLFPKASLLLLFFLLKVSCIACQTPRVCEGWPSCTEKLEKYGRILVWKFTQTPFFQALAALQVCFPALLQLWSDSSLVLDSLWCGWGEQAPGVKSLHWKVTRWNLIKWRFIFYSTLWALRGKDVMTTIGLIISIIWFLCHCWFIYHLSVTSVTNC